MSAPTQTHAPHDPRHAPVLIDEVIAGLAPAPGETHVDGTFGAGGYTRAILATGVERVVAFDRDPDAIAEGQPLVAQGEGRLLLVADRFSRMAEALADLGIDGVDGVTLDIGVSSMQLDRAERGFSFQADGPLDMRMEQAGESAADFLNTADEETIANVLYELGEEPRSRRVAHAIVDARPITRTGELAAIVRRALGHKPHDKKDPATRSFQAIRIHLNRELGELEDGLAAAERVLKPGGRIAVVSFHSGEDRIVKRFLRQRSGATPGGSRHRPDGGERGPAPSFEAVGKAVRASDDEIARNPRSRSATLRVARRTASPAWPVSLNPVYVRERPCIMMAARFRSVTWVAVALVPALGCYLVTQYVAAERAQLARVEAQIGHSRKAIRDLETELGTRGSMAQLERWNSQTLALAAPTAQQFINGDVQLASLTALPALPRPAIATVPAATAVAGDVRQAALTTPAAPVAAAPAGVRQAAFVPAPKPREEPAHAARFTRVKEAAEPASPIRQASFKPARRAAPEPEAEAQPLLRQATYSKPPRDQVRQATTKVAMLSSGPLDSGTLADIGRIARSERGSRRP